MSAFCSAQYPFAVYGDIYVSLLLYIFQHYLSIIYWVIIKIEALSSASIFPLTSLHPVLLPSSSVSSLIPYEPLSTPN